MTTAKAQLKDIPIKGVENRANYVLGYIDQFRAANDGRFPDFKEIRKSVEHATEASVWTYLFFLEQRGHIDLELSCRAPVVSRRNH